MFPKLGEMFTHPIVLAYDLNLYLFVYTNQPRFHDRCQCKSSEMSAWRGGVLWHVRWKTAKERRSQRSLSKSRWTFWSFTFTCDTACLAWQFEPSMQNITELKHCHDVAKCKTVFVESQSESHQVLREHHLWRPSWPMTWNDKEGIAKHSKADRQVSGTHTRPCTDPAFHTEPFDWLPDYLVIDSSSYIVACTPELAGLVCCKHATSLKDYERKNEMFSAESLVVSLEKNRDQTWWGSDREIVQMIFSSRFFGTITGNWWGLRSRGGEDGHGGRVTGNVFFSSIVHREFEVLISRPWSKSSRNPPAQWPLLRP